MQKTCQFWLLTFWLLTASTAVRLYRMSKRVFALYIVSNLPLSVLFEVTVVPTAAAFLTGLLLGALGVSLAARLARRDGSAAWEPLPAA